MKTINSKNRDDNLIYLFNRSIGKEDFYQKLLDNKDKENLYLSKDGICFEKLPGYHFLVTNKMNLYLEESKKYCYSIEEQKKYVVDKIQLSFVNRLLSRNEKRDKSLLHLSRDNYLYSASILITMLYNGSLLYKDLSEEEYSVLLRQLSYFQDKTILKKNRQVGSYKSIKKLGKMIRNYSYLSLFDDNAINKKNLLLLFSQVFYTYFPE